MRALALFGATGSIGGSTLDIVRQHRERFRVVALTAHRDITGIVSRCAEFDVPYAAIADASLLPPLRDALDEAGLKTKAFGGAEGLDAIARLPDVDTVVAAIVGAAGLSSTLAAAEAGKRVLLANKEAIVIAGGLLRDALRRGGGTLLPVDSEHNAVFQCLPQGYDGDPHAYGVERIVLTASGGPFRGWDDAQLATVTPDQACAHPNWRMGRKISVDSATLMNKGLEVIEAHWLFGLPAERIDVVLHPQSIVHSLVGYRDGSMLAQLGNPDMRTAIAYALAWPERMSAGVAPLDLATIARLDFATPDGERFRCLPLAFRALRAGGCAPAVLNAANEVAVEAFLNGGLAFMRIADVVADTLDATPATAAASLDALLAADRTARERAAIAVRRWS
jgi:1-deoxy-D-xylulose-5-phosphate reductoisomerase